MSSVWKFELSPNADIEMPVGAQILSVHGQRDAICLWALVDPDAEKETRRFVVVGTGSRFNADCKMEYLGTAFLHGESLVFHAFELVK